MPAFLRVIVASLAASAPAFALAVDLQWQSRAEGSELTFSAWYEGEEIPGRFSRFRVRLATDAATGEPAALTVEVEVDSADMNDDEINQELAEPDWFHSAAFPVAQFFSDDIAASGDGYVAAGRLRIKDVERPLDVPFTWRRDGDQAVIRGSVDLSRLTWQVGGGEWASDASLADRVRVKFGIDLFRAE